MTNKGTLDGFGRDGRLADVRILTFDFDEGSGATLTTGAKRRYKSIPYDCTIVGWRLMAGPSGSIVIDVWSDQAANFAPTVADTLIRAAAGKPTLTTAVFAEDFALNHWRTDLDCGEVLEVNIDSITSVVRAVLELHIIRRTT